MIRTGTGLGTNPQQSAGHQFRVLCSGAIGAAPHQEDPFTVLAREAFPFEGQVAGTVEGAPLLLIHRNEPRPEVVPALLLVDRGQSPVRRPGNRAMLAGFVASKTPPSRSPGVPHSGPVRVSHILVIRGFHRIVQNCSCSGDALVRSQLSLQFAQG